MLIVDGVAATYATPERIERVQYAGDQRQLHELALTTVYALTRTIAGDYLPLPSAPATATSKQPHSGLAKVRAVFSGSCAGAATVSGIWWARRGWRRPSIT